MSSPEQPVEAPFLDVQADSRALLKFIGSAWRSRRPLRLEVTAVGSSTLGSDEQLFPFTVVCSVTSGVRYAFTEPDFYNRRELEVTGLNITLPKFAGAAATGPFIKLSEKRLKHAHLSLKGVQRNAGGTKTPADAAWHGTISLAAPQSAAGESYGPFPIRGH